MVDDQNRGVDQGMPEGTMPLNESQGDANIPRNDGGWDGEPGNSEWISFNPEVVRATGGEGILYVDNEPVMSPFAVEQAVLPGFDTRSRDFSAARRELMRQYPGRWRNITHVEAWETQLVPDLQGNSLPERQTWHHEPDGTTISLVPTAMHDNVPHAGGIANTNNGTRGDVDAPFSGNPL